MLSKFLTHLFLIGSLFIGTAAHAGVVVYTNDFEAGPLGAEFSNAGAIENTEGYSQIGFGNGFLRNDTGSIGVSPTQTTLTLTDLPVHTSVNVGFLLAIIESWDGAAAPGVGPDSFELRLDNILVFSEVFTNIPSQASLQTASTDERIEPLTERFNPAGTSLDSAYDYTSFTAFQNLSHSSDTLTLSFTAAGPLWEGGINESFAIDNISISLNGVTAVPEPGSLASLLSGLMAFGLMRWRRRSLV